MQLLKRILEKIRYPKLGLLLISFSLAYLLFQGKELLHFQDTLNSFGYFGIFLIGMLFAYGFTAGPATAMLLMLSTEYNLIAAGLIAGLGAMTADFLIFKLIRHSFMDEMARVSQYKWIKATRDKIPFAIRKNILPIFAGIIIASPLPDEIGVALLASVKSISQRTFFILSYVLNMTGILIILSLGKII